MIVKCNFFIFTFFTFLFSEEQLLWDLGVKINNVEKKILIDANNLKQNNDNKLFNELDGLSNKLNISQNIIDKENKILNKKIKEPLNPPTLVFDNEKRKDNSSSNAYQMGRYKDAIKYLDKINKPETNKIEQNKIDYLKANAYFNLGEYEKAQELLNKIIFKNQPGLLDDALLLNGIILKQKGKKKEALNMFSQIILDHPNSEFYESAQIQKRILSNKKHDK